MLLEEAFKADFLLKLGRGLSRKFNIKGTARNFNPQCGAAKVTVASEIWCQQGADPNQFSVPREFLYNDFKVKNYEKRH